jgi:hypothetical protein
VAMKMNITRYSLKRSTPLLTEAIRQADFVAVDFEFSGLQADAELANHQTDSVELRYWKYKQNIELFTPMQLGLCCFRYFEEEQRLEAMPFNFYLMPRFEKTFLSQVSSIQFLAAHGFNFNSWVYDSVPYMQIKEYRDKVVDPQVAKRVKKFTQSQDSLMAKMPQKDPDCTIFSNSKFPELEAWLQHARPLAAAED